MARVLRSDDRTDVLAALDAETEELASKAADAIYRELSGYTQVPRESIQRSMRANVSRAVSTLRTGLPPTSETSDEAEAITLERANQGVSIDDIMRAYRLALRVIHDRFLELATDASTDPAEILASSNLLWEVGDWFIAAAASAFRDHQVELTVRQSVRRTELLRDVLSGMLSDADLRAAATTLELDPTQRFTVFCVPRVDRVDVSALSNAHPGGVAEIAGRVFGLVAEPFDPVVTNVAVAIGPVRALGSIQESTQVASRIAELIVEDAPGCYRVADLPWRLAAHAEPEVIAELRRKFVAPMQERGQFGELLLASVAMYLTCDLNVSAAAERLVVHPNTLRYRLAKYEDLVGVRLGSVRTTTELTMALDLRL